jgi:dihydrofolate synthase/folylpolyglutamate synthase
MAAYKQALAYLLEQLPMFQRQGAAAYKADLNNITALCDLLDNPQRDLKCIHIAGTNGKGSVTHIIASILQAQGLKVGVFSSPHYKDYRERIKINGKLISKKYVSHFVVKHKAEFKEINASFFEITNAMAFQYFKDREVDIVVLETGMGGRLDSTNIIIPLLSVITNISFDHQQFLGDTLPKIAMEKAGIIKPNVPVVIGETQDEIMQVFIQKAKQCKSEIVFADTVEKIDLLEDKLTKLSFTYHGKKYKTDLTGEYQLKNILTALVAVERLRKMKFEITDKALKNGLKSVRESTYFLGRFMVMKKRPLVIFDSAHNEAGLNVLLSQIASQHVKKIHFVYGTVSDKDLGKVFPLLPLDATFYFCKPSIPRGKDALELSQEAAENGLFGEAYESVKRAFKTAVKAASKDDIVIVSGSIFVVAEVI